MARVILIGLFIGCLALLPTPRIAASDADVLVVCPESWRDALAVWVDYRESQSRRIGWALPQATPETTMASLRKAAGATPPKWIVLVGDAPADGAAWSPTTVPCWRPAATINRRWGSEPTLATDRPYGDWNGDGAAEIAVGRLPCDTPAEVARYARRLIAYETDRSATVDQHRLNLVAAPGNFSPLLDGVIEATAAQVLTRLTPPSCDLNLTYADWRSPYCPFPPSMPQAVRRSLEQRSLAWVYLGHGHRHTLDVLRTPAGHARLLDRQLVTSLRGERFPPLAAIIACYAGAYDGREDCLAEDLVRQPGGPLATLAGSRVTMPYGNSVLGLELLTGLFHGEHQTLGELIVAAKARTLSKQPQETKPETSEAGVELRKAVEAIAAGFTPDKNDRLAERVEHAQMYNLLGDPLLSLRRPANLPLMAEWADGGKRVIRVAGESPFTGQRLLQIKPAKLTRRRTAGNRIELRLNDHARDEFSQAYADANRVAIAVDSTADSAAGKFTAELTLPDEATGGEWVVTARVAGEEGIAVGHARLVGPR